MEKNSNETPTHHPLPPSSFFFQQQDVLK